MFARCGRVFAGWEEGWKDMAVCARPTITPDRPAPGPMLWAKLPGLRMEDVEAEEWWRERLDGGLI